MIKQEEVYKIGKLGKPHGVKGEINLLFDDDVFDRVDAQYLILDIDEILVPFFMEEYRFRSDSTALVKFQDIDTEDRARDLTGCEVYFPYKLSDNDPTNISWNQIIGFQLIDLHINNVVGTIQSVDNSTINILFEVKTENGKEILIPASEELIEEVDIENRQIKINLPEGILDLE